MKIRPGVYGPETPHGKTPALVFTGTTLIAFAQGKPIVMGRSTSYGQSWSTPRALVQDAENPAPVWIGTSGRLLLLFNRPGVKIMNKYMLMESTDQGVSFSAPRQICNGCTVDGVPLPNRWGFQLPGPPGGIVASNGRILQCCDHSLSPKTVCGNAKTPGGGPGQCDKGNHVIFSDSDGAHWNVSGLVAQGAPVFGDECSLAQIPGTGVLVLNTRVD
eukprot:SAG25_NODE_1137_length_3822_cov_1.656460_1_plen_216_part_10